MDIKLSCSCGQVQGMATGVTPASGNRVVCCCSSCQSFANHLNRSDILDEYGGTDLYQTSQAQVTISSGADQLSSLKLSKKGLTRWYTNCCNTPVGNTMNAKMPFVGVIHNFMQHTVSREEELGPVLAYVQTQYAIGTPDYPHSAKKFPAGITFRIMRKMLTWKIQGKHKPSAFFNDDGTSVSEPNILTGSV